MRKMLRIEVTVKTVSKVKAGVMYYVTNANGASNPTLSDLKFTGDSRVSYSDITKKVK